MIPVRSDRIYSIQSAYKCARHELKLYIFTEAYDVTLVRAWRRCAAQIHEWMFWSEVNFSGFPCSASREQWTLCREHVNRNTVHAWSALLTSWLSESGVLTKRDMQNMQSGGARGLELRTSGLITSTWLNLIISKIFTILHYPYCCYVHTLYTCLQIPLAYPCLYYYLLSPQYTILHI